MRHRDHLLEFDSIILHWPWEHKVLHFAFKFSIRKQFPLHETPSTMTWTKFLKPRFILLSSLFVVFCDRWKILEAVWYQKEDQTNVKEMDAQKLGPISSLKSIQNFDIYKEKRLNDKNIKKEYGDGLLEIFKVMDWQHCASFCIRVCMKIHFEPILRKN